MSAPSSPRAWASSSPVAPRSAGSARQAARTARAASDLGAGGSLRGPTANPLGLETYKGYSCDCKQCEREFFGVKRREKHSEVGRCRNATSHEILEQRAAMAVDRSGDPMSPAPPLGPQPSAPPPPLFTDAFDVAMSSPPRSYASVAASSDAEAAVQTTTAVDLRLSWMARATTTWAT